MEKRISEGSFVAALSECVKRQRQLLVPALSEGTTDHGPCLCELCAFSAVSAIGFWV